VVEAILILIGSPYDGRYRTAVVVKLLSAVMNGDTGSAASIFVVGAFIGILKSTPATNVMDQNNLKPGISTLDVVDELLKPFSTL